MSAIHEPIGYDDDGTPFDCNVCGRPWPCGDQDLMTVLQVSLEPARRRQRRGLGRRVAR